jgi:pimeloyl-ACP methyl ester carboxylesterase
MGQPSKSSPDEPVRSAADYVEWLTATLDALRLDRIFLVGMSYGGWLALRYAIAVPERVQKLVLLSPGGFVPVARQFSLRGMLMLFFPTRFTVNSFMRWLGFIDAGARPVLNLMYLGLKHFRLPPETLRVLPDVVRDDQLREMHVATLLLMGDREVMFDAATALARAYRLISNVEANLVPRSSHDMCFSQHRIVDARILNFLRKTRTDDQDKTTERSVA